MARNHGLLLASIWSDPDWLALTGGAQRVYALLLSQPKLSLIGLLDYLPTRWARFAADTDLASVEADIDELEASRFVLVDRHTDELLIRTLVKHDITTVERNRNLLAGMWNAWGAIESRQLRLEAVRNIPPSVWESERCQPHPAALEMRRSLQSEPAVPTHSPNPQSELPSSLHLPPATLLPPPSDAEAESKQPGNSRGDDPSEAGAAQPEIRTADDRQAQLAAAVELLVARELDRNPSRGRPDRHAAAVRKGKLTDHHQAGHRYLVDDPTLSAAQLADLLEPPAGQRPAAPRPASGNPRGVDPAHQRASLARAEEGTAAVRALADEPIDPAWGDEQAAAGRFAGLRAAHRLPTGTNGA